MAIKSSPKPVTYKDAGVDIDQGNQLVTDIKPFIQKTHRKELLSSLGGYAGLFALDLKKYPEPVLVSTTDGVGTKLKIAIEMESYNSIAIDLVAMCVNDLICCGAEPLFFLDYFATSFLKREIATSIIQNMAIALSQINCTLIGGETAEMPGLYQEGEFDLAGFSVGVVNRNQIIDGQKILADDVIIGLASSGIHSNGFSLVREIVKRSRINILKDRVDSNKPFGKELLVPTTIYVNPIMDLMKSFTLKGIAHITGGGLLENIVRILPTSVLAQITKSTIKTPQIFKTLQRLGNVPDPEMWRVFNMGIGLVIIVPSEQASQIIERLTALEIESYRIGVIVNRTEPEKGVVLV